MRVEVLVKPNARKEELIEVDSKTFQIKVSVPPEGGKANKRVIEMLAKHLGIAKSKLTIVKGQKSRQKVVEIDGNL